MRVGIALLSGCLAAVALGFPAHAADKPFKLPTDDGYRGIWYANQKSGDEYVYKYSGGMATYPQQHIPIAIHAPAVNKTFFVYGGTNPRGSTLLHMVSYFDHANGTVPRPRILLDKKTTDAHDNPTLSIDGDGHLWIFSNAHGTSRKAYIHRSTKPYAIDEFEKVLETNFSYSQPWYLDGQGFLFLHTRYSEGRVLHWMRSVDGRTWSEPQRLAAIELGHYQISNTRDGCVATAFNFHPRPDGLNARTNLYFAATRDMGHNWTTIDGRPLAPPLTEPKNAALVHDYQAEGLLVYLKDLGFDEAGHPVVLFLTSRGYESGPKNAPRTWRTARWTGSQWVIRDAMTSDNNYDFGSLYLESDTLWRIIAPTDEGPQAYNPGGQVVMWTSGDQGTTWQKIKRLTEDPKHNHTYVRRPVGAQPEFYALWAAADAREKSESALYFTNREGDHVWRLPPLMNGDAVQPEIAW